MRRAPLGILTPAPLLGVVSIGLASLTFLGTPSAFAVPILGYLGFGATVLLCRRVRWGEDRDFFVNLMLLGIAVRFVVLLLIHETVGPYVFAPDQVTYEGWGRGLLAFLRGEGPMPSRLEGTLQLGYPALNAALFAIFGEAVVAPAVVNIFLSVWGVVPLYALLRRLLPEERLVARIACGLTVLFPSLILWSTLNIREAPTIFIVLSAVYFLVRVQHRADLTGVAGALLSLAVLTFFREYLTSLIGMAGAAGVLMGRSKAPVRSLLVGSIMLVAVLLAFQTLGLGGSLTGEPSLERAQLLRESFQFGAGSAYGQEADVSTPLGALRYLPVGLAYFLLAPFPWDITSTLQAITLPETLLWWAIFPFGVWGVIRVVRHGVRSFTVPLTTLLAVTFAYALVESNVGTAYRHRGQVLPLMFVFCAIGLTHLLNRWRARREAEQRRRQAARSSLRGSIRPAQRTP